MNLLKRRKSVFCMKFSEKDAFDALESVARVKVAPGESASSRCILRTPQGSPDSFFFHVKKSNLNVDPSQVQSVIVADAR